MSPNLLYIAPTTDYYSSDSSSNSHEQMEHQSNYSNPYPTSSVAPPSTMHAVHGVSKQVSPITGLDSAAGHSIDNAILLSDDEVIETSPSPAAQSTQVMSNSYAIRDGHDSGPEAVREVAYASDPWAIFQVPRNGEAADEEISTEDSPREDSTNGLARDQTQPYGPDLPPSYAASIEHDLRAQLDTLRQQLASQAAHVKHKDAHIHHLTTRCEEDNHVLGQQTRQIYTLQNELGWAKTRAKKAETVVVAASLAVGCNAGRNWPEFGRRMDELSKAVKQAESD